MCLWLWRVLVKLYLMVWKSTLHTIRHNIPKTLSNVLVPVAFFLLMTISRKEYVTEKLANATLVGTYKEEFFFPPYGPNLLNAVAYSPENKVFDKLWVSVQELFKDNMTYIPVANSSDLEALLNSNRSIIAGIQFNHEDNVTEIPDNFNFSLRFPAMMRWQNMPWPTHMLYKEQAFDRYPRERPSWDFYHKEGFLNLMFRVMSILHNRVPIANGALPYGPFGVKQFPTYPQNLNFEKFQFLFPPLVLICFYYPYLCTICCVVVERNKKTKEMMRLMGMSNWIYWLILCLQKILLHIISVTIAVALMKARLGYSKAVFENSNFNLVWSFFTAYCTCSTLLGFLLGILFTDIKLAVSVSTIIWFLSFVPFSFTQFGYNIAPHYLKMILFTFPNTAMGYGVKIIFLLELLEEGGLNSSTLWSDVKPNDTLSVGLITHVMTVTPIVFLLIFIYIVPIFPGTYGIAAPIFYPFTPNFWGRKRTHKYKRLRNVDFSEYEPDNRTPGIQIINLTKQFVKGNSIVRNLSLNIYQNEITVLCGPNGGGMSTLMLISTGIIKATSGSVIIDGYEIQKRTGLARKSMGFCPQQNILFDELTAREHILFYSLIKGSGIRTAYAEVKKYSKLFEFENDLKVLASNLSAGTQRKLSLAIALCGRSKYVFLDHPTHGMDATVRRLIWNVLINEKKKPAHCNDHSFIR